MFVLLMLLIVGEILSSLADIQYTPNGMYSKLYIGLNDHSLCKVNVMIPKSHTFYTWNIETTCEFKAVGDGGLGDPLRSKSELDSDRAPRKEINFTCFKGSNSVLLPLAERYNLTDPQEDISSSVVIDIFCDGLEDHREVQLEIVEPITEYVPKLKPTLYSTGALIVLGIVAVLYSTFIKNHI